MRRRQRALVGSLCELTLKDLVTVATLAKAVIDLVRALAGNG
jgi:hypothetical protein